ncbi:unnamed protein product [Colias eurytheme]|nr:unnamed protein product [Colias eurytheme]
MAYVMKFCIGIIRWVAARAARAAIDVETGRAPRRQTDRRPETPCLATRPHLRAALANLQCLLRTPRTADRPVSHVLCLINVNRYAVSRSVHVSTSAPK